MNNLKNILLIALIAYSVFTVFEYVSLSRGISKQRKEILREHKIIDSLIAVNKTILAGRDSVKAIRDSVELDIENNLENFNGYEEIIDLIDTHDFHEFIIISDEDLPQ